jgi:uncharacterized protein
MLGAFAKAYATLGDPAYLDAAENNVRFLHRHLWDPQTQTLFHRWRDGERDTVQLLNAYAFLLAGLIDLYEATLHPAHLDWAVSIADAMIRRFHDSSGGGFWQSPADSTDLILRCKEDYDGAEPSGNSIATLALLKLSAITGRSDLRQIAHQTLRWMAQRLEQLPQAVPHMLLALDFALDDPTRAVVVGDPSAPATRELLAACHSIHLPRKVVLGQAGPVDAFSKSLPGEPTARVYVCSGNACLPPAANPVELRLALGASLKSHKS